MIIIVGPTASGKTGFSIKLAKHINAEIIGADSVQIYKDLLIGAATPTAEEMQGVPHHLVGILDVTEEMDAGKFLHLSHTSIKDIASRNKSVVMVGGTNFYVDAFLNGLSPIPRFTKKEKKQIEDKYYHKSVEELFSLLRKIDPEWAASISSPNDIQRIQRGLEVYELTGRTLSDWNKLPRVQAYKGKAIKIGMQWDRADLYERVNLRTKNMVENGIIDEVESLSQRGFYPENCKVLQSIGYKETFDYIRGIINCEADLVYKISLHTRHLAKRQLTWLRRYNDIVWVSPHSEIDNLLSVHNLT